MPLETVARMLLPLALLLASCNVQGPALAGYPGLQFKVISFYDNNALEQNATCTQPRMRSVTGTQIIEETPQQVVMNVRYYWYDESSSQFDDNMFFPAPVLNRCNGFAERTFTFVKMTDGSLDVRSMSGPQRRPSS